MSKCKHELLQTLEDIRSRTKNALDLKLRGRDTWKRSSI